ncbi:MAG: YbaN family protein [Planctomycetota bacterium]
MPTLTAPTTAVGPRDAWLRGETIHLHGADCSAELAGRLLASEGVRSVILDRPRNETLIHLQSDAAEDADLQMAKVGALVSQQQAALAATHQRLEAPAEIVCWLDAENGVDSYFRAPVMATGWKRLAYLTGAAVTFALAAVGAVLPGLPTTPFLLLTSYCLLRSSRPLHDRLLRSRVFGGLLRDWHTHRGVRPGVKTKSLAVMAVVVGATVLLSGLPGRALFGIVGCSMIGVVCICRLRVIR